MKSISRTVTDSLGVRLPQASAPRDGVSQEPAAETERRHESVSNRDAVLPLPLLVLRIALTLGAAWVGAQVGFFVWMALLLSLGYPSELPDGSSIPSLSRVVLMNDWQVALEYCGSLAIPVLSASLCALAAWRLQTRRELR